MREFWDSIADSKKIRGLKTASVLKRAITTVFVREFHGLGEFLSVSEVKVSEDSRNATVFVITREESASKEEIIQSLNEASDMIRRSTFRYLKMKYVPRLHFKLDLGFDNLVKVNESLALFE